MKYVICLPVLLFCVLKGYTQALLSPKDINNRIFSELFIKGPNTTKLKDSVDFYTFAIELKVIRINKNTIVDSIILNDRIVYILYKDFNFLKEINYYNVMKGQDKAIIVIPVGIMIAYVKHPVSPIPLLKAEELIPKISKMFNYNFKLPEKRSANFIYLDPVMCLCGTKVYD